jgi:hypothetical protein
MVLLLGLLEKLGRAQHHPSRREIDGPDELIHERHQELWSIGAADDEVRNGSGVPDLLDFSQTQSGLVHRLKTDEVSLEAFSFGRRLKILAEDDDRGTHQTIGGGAIGDSFEGQDALAPLSRALLDLEAATAAVGEDKQHAVDLFERQGSRIKGPDDYLSIEPAGTCDVTDPEVSRGVH